MLCNRRNIASTLKASILATIIVFTSCQESVMDDSKAYKISKLNHSMQIDGDWEKQQWQKAKALNLTHFMGEVPDFTPTVEAKVMYDEKNIYLIFRVADKYVRCITTDVNGPVYEDACVEFFFAPDTNHSERYFNLEINCGGTPLMYYNTIPRQEFIICNPNDMAMIEIAHSLPSVVDPEITDPVTWTIECRIPLELLRKYVVISQPEEGICWRANFYKVAENSSNPHYLTWKEVTNPTPDFHLPSFFGRLEFEK